MFGQPHSARLDVWRVLLMKSAGILVLWSCMFPSFIHCCVSFLRNAPSSSVSALLCSASPIQIPDPSCILRCIGLIHQPLVSLPYDACSRRPVCIVEVCHLFIYTVYVKQNKLIFINGLRVSATSFRVRFNICLKQLVNIPRRFPVP